MSNLKDYLKSLNIAEINQVAQQNAVKIPSSISVKERKIAYLIAKMEEQERGISSAPSRKDLDLATLTPVGIRDPSEDQRSSTQWLAELYYHGWTVVPIKGWGDSIEREEISASYCHAFFDWIESSSNSVTGEATAFNRNDRSTWISSNLPPNTRGIFKHWIGHAPFVWQIRTHPGVKQIFSQIWQVRPEELITSFDGGSFHLPNLAKRLDQSTVDLDQATAKRYFKEWFHVDQPRASLFDQNISSFISVQGIVHLTDNTTFEIENATCTASDGGLILIEKSKDVFDSYMQAHPSFGHSWEYANIDDSSFTGKKLLRILAPSGYMTLWDSRMFHSSSPSVGNHYRLCTYVSMFPRSVLSSSLVKRRRDYFSKGMMTGHWCYGPYFGANGKEPRTYGKAIYRPSL